MGYCTTNLICEPVIFTANFSSRNGTLQQINGNGDVTAKKTSVLVRPKTKQ
jgi:hypothetical protein